MMSFLAGFVVGVFSMISRFMKADTLWADITLSSLSKGLAEGILKAVPAESLGNVLGALFYDVPLGGVLMGTGVIFFVIALFVKEY